MLLPKGRPPEKDRFRLSKLYRSPTDTYCCEPFLPLSAGSAWGVQKDLPDLILMRTATPSRMTVHGRDESVGATDAQTLLSDDLIAPPPRSIAPAAKQPTLNRAAPSRAAEDAEPLAQASIPPAPDRRYITAALMLVMVLASME